MTVIDVISANLPIFRDLRQRMGQLELAQRVGVSRRTIARLENAEVSDPGVALMGRIATELGVTLALLTERKVEAMTVALPDDVCRKLRGKNGGQVLAAMVEAARGR